MFSRGVRAAAVCLLVLTTFAITTYGIRARAQEPAESAAPTIAQLVDACRAAKDVFAPRTEEDLTKAKAELVAALARLDRKLNVSGANSAGWRKFLRWDETQKQMAREAGPDFAVLDAVYAKYDSGHNGLDLVAFAGVRQALRAYLTTARAIGNEKLGDQYKGLLDALADRLEAYQKSPATETALEIGDAIRWLEEAGQAPELIESIRRYFSQPNVFLEASADFIAAGISGPVDRTGPFEDVIMGTQITGTEHTTGDLTVELVPREEFAEIDTVFRGTINTDTIGRNGPARVASEGITKVATRKAIRIDAERVWTLPARSNAVTSTTVKSVQTTRGGGMVAQTARQQVYAQKAQSERIAAQHAEQRTNQRVDEQADEQIGQLADNYQDTFRKPLLDRGQFPQMLRFHSTNEALYATALHGGLTGLGTPAAPPAVEGEHAVAARLHESVVNNFAAMALGGMIVEEETLRAQLTERLGSTPAWLEPDPESQPWTITFAQRHPFTVSFGDGGFTATLRGRQYDRGENSYPGMNITAVYKIEETAEGPKAVRQGELQLLPPGFSPGKKLTASQQVLRTLLEKRFSKIFTEEIVPEPLVLSGAFEKAGELVLQKWEASGGWMVLTWKRQPKTEEAGDGPSPAAKSQ